eukprot:6182923-Pleurochrysis_carterae.AAC.1
MLPESEVLALSSRRALFASSRSGSIVAPAMASGLGAAWSPSLLVGECHGRTPRQVRQPYPDPKIHAQSTPSLCDP